MRIHHIQITAIPDKEAACRAFYGDVLRLEEIPKPEALKGRGGAWYRVGDIQLHLGIENSGSGGASRRHVCFEVPDLTAMRARLEAAGYPVEEAAPVEGLERFFTRDPAGNKVELARPC